MNRDKQMTRKQENSSRVSMKSAGPPTPIYSTPDYATPVYENQPEELVVDPALVDELEKETQETLLRTFEYFYEQESESMIHALSDSRVMIKHSMVI